MKRQYAYQFRLQLTQEQTEYFIQSAGCVRKVWNYFLAEKLQSQQGKYQGYAYYANKLPQLKQEFDYLKKSPSQALQQTLKNLDKAFKGFLKV